MTLRFRGKRIYCEDAHTDLVRGGRQLYRFERWYWGGHGLSELVGGIGARDIVCQAIIGRPEKWDKASGLDKLQDYIWELGSDLWLGRNGKIKSKVTTPTGVIKDYPTGCTLVEATPIPFKGLDDAKPVDATDQDQFKSWIQLVQFKWRQIN